MKSKLIYLLTIILFIGCKNDSELTFEPLSISNEECEKCSSVKINIPKALGNTKLVESINISLKEEIIEWLNFDEESNAQSIEEAMDAFINDYKDLNAKYPEESMPWEATINGEKTFENAIVLTLKLESYLFTGGAHGLSNLRFLNFDKLKGTELDRQELFKSEKRFVTFAETLFREQENIPAEAGINSTGFMFETESFYLPENIGYTDKGLLLFYEPYEIASYADGPITLTIPYHQANEFLKLPIQP